MEFGSFDNQLDIEHNGTSTVEIVSIIAIDNDSFVETVALSGVYMVLSYITQAVDRYYPLLLATLANNSQDSWRMSTIKKMTHVLLPHHHSLLSPIV